MYLKIQKKLNTVTHPRIFISRRAEDKIPTFSSPLLFFCFNDKNNNSIVFDLSTKSCNGMMCINNGSSLLRKGHKILVQIFNALLSFPKKVNNVLWSRKLLTPSQRLIMNNQKDVQLPKQKHAMLVWGKRHQEGKSEWPRWLSV